MKKVRVRLRNNGYYVLIGSGLLSKVGYYLKETGFDSKVVIITDSTVKDLYGITLKHSLIASGFKVSLLEVPDGEDRKSLETAGRLYNELTNCHAERTTPILALGGGVIGDLAGFVAATYMRGVPLIQLPTTLLAQVDSSIGGKVAVNHGMLKNKIGAFYQPKLVISDITSLKSLTNGELKSGMGEVIKYAMIWDKEFFTFLKMNLQNINSLNGNTLEYIVSVAARIKGQVVEKDEKDMGLRNILNFGHTIGHALETVSDFGISHGQAVACGMIGAAKISSRMGTFDSSELSELKQLVQETGLSVEMPDFDMKNVLQAMKHDKKVRGGKIRFILPKAIGEVFMTDKVSASLVKEVLINNK